MLYSVESEKLSSEYKTAPSRSETVNEISRARSKLFVLICKVNSFGNMLGKGITDVS